MRRKKSTLKFLVPAMMIAAILLIFALEIYNQANPFFSATVAEKLPSFEAPDLWGTDSYLSPTDFKGKVVLLNVWASWCPSCRGENPLLLDIQHKHTVPIYSLVYKDDVGDARAFLSAQGNPYTKSGLDSKGVIAHQLRVYGTPETFLIDKHGMIRYRQVGVIDDRTWQEVLLPLVNKYQMEK